MKVQDHLRVVRELLRNAKQPHSTIAYKAACTLEDTIEEARRLEAVETLTYCEKLLARRTGDPLCGTMFDT